MYQTSMKKWSINKQKYTLVISGWGARGFYALGIIKALEELGIAENIENIYWVSIGATIAAFFAAWYTADEMLEIWLGLKLVSRDAMSFSKKSLLSMTILKNLFTKKLPKSFSWLKIPVHIWAVDAKKAQFHFFSSGELLPPLLGSMAIPGIFPPIEHKRHLLMDWWLLNNFPVEIAKKENPKNKIIGIYLNHFSEVDKWPESIYDSLNLAYTIIMRWPSMAKLSIADYTLTKPTPLKTIDMNKELMKKTFSLWHKDAIKLFSK